jgi:hypothetical protein
MNKAISRDLLQRCFLKTLIQERANIPSPHPTGPWAPGHGPASHQVTRPPSPDPEARKFSDPSGAYRQPTGKARRAWNEGRELKKKVLFTTILAGGNGGRKGYGGKSLPWQ